MDNNEQLLLTLANLQLTDVLDIPVMANNQMPKQLASTGKVKAVVLRLNEYVLNTETQTDAPYFYWSNSAKSQTFEVLRGVNSQVIFCTDLSQVWIRYPVLSGRDESITIRVMVYS